MPLDVAAGEAACGMAIDTYGLRAVAEAGEDRMAFWLPEALTVVNPDGIGVLKGAPEVEVAELFVQFIPGLVRRYSQYAAVRMDPYEFKTGVEFDLEKKNGRWGILNALIGACIIDVHDDLADAWRALNHLPPDDPRLRALLEPPVGEEELLRMAEERWKDAAFRADTVARWSDEAKNRYRRLAKEK